MKVLLQPLYSAYRLILRNPKYRTFVSIGGLIYLLSPLDLATDFIPLAGWIDNGVIATLLVTEVAQILLEQRQLHKSKTAGVDVVSTS